jgi:peroxiredoxin
MTQLRDEYSSFLAKKAEIIVIGPENAKDFKEYWQKERMPFHGIADPQHVIANLYKQEVKLFKLGRMPALFVIDRDGLVRFNHHGQSMSDIPANRDVLSLLEKINQAAG